MTLIATIRDETGAVLGAYPLRPADDGTARLGGKLTVERNGLCYMVTTTLEPNAATNRERMATEQGIMECCSCGAAIPFKGWGIFSVCPECGREQAANPGRNGSDYTAETPDDLPL